MFTTISQCRICGNRDLKQVLDLGNQALTGVFPAKATEHVDSMPLILVKCNDEENSKACGLLQLKHSGDLSAMYGLNYGYRSGLNQSMVQHLTEKVQKILKTVSLKAQDVVLDIGSNDCTLLKTYPKGDLHMLGIDPTGLKFKDFYPSHIKLVPDFFSAKNFSKICPPGKKAKIITSISMFYDLEDPIQFMRDIYDCLEDDGVWVFEQSYMPTMLKKLSYDTVCHEHLEYYALKQVKWMTDIVGLHILDVEFNDINGGSFSVTAAKKTSPLKQNTGVVEEILAQEFYLELHRSTPYEKFNRGIDSQRELLANFLKAADLEGKTVFGYGASTKGNVLLQYCHLNSKKIPCIAEVNEAKFGCFTPGTLIPIVSEKEAHQAKPDYFLVLPWHFKDNIVNRESDFLKGGGKLVFPLPAFEVVG